MVCVTGCRLCANFKAMPQRIGGSAKCSKYKEIPREIFFRGGKCKFFKEKVDTNGKRKK